VSDSSLTCRQAGQLGGLTKWSRVTDRTAATAAARAGLEQRFLDEADGDPVRAQTIRRLYYTRLAFKSAQARRARKGDAT
jgi:hypothetical protein